MNEKAEFAVEILKEYAKQNQVLPRSTSDLSKLEEWLIIELLRVKKLTIPRVVNCKHEDYTPCYGREGELMFKQCGTCGEEFD